MSQFTNKTARRGGIPSYGGKHDEIVVVTVVDQQVERLESQGPPAEEGGELARSKQGSTDTLVKAENIV